MVGYKFPGDEHLPFDIESELRAVGPAVYTLPQALVDVARFFGITVSEETHRRMECLWAASLCTDSLVDDAPTDFKMDAIVLFGQLMRGEISHDETLPGWVTSKRGHAGRVVAIMHSAFAGTPEATLLPDAGMDIVRVARAKSGASNLFSYLTRVIEENTMTTRLIELCMSEAERSHPAFQSYMRWCIISSVSAALQDAYEDFYDDHQHGLVRVRPTRVRRLMIWAVWRLYSVQTLRNLPALRATVESTFEITPKPSQNWAQRMLCAWVGNRLKTGKEVRRDSRA